MSESQQDHIDPDPTRPSQAEGEAADAERPDSDPAQEPAPNSADSGDPDPLRPSQAEGEPQDEDGDSR